MLQKNQKKIQTFLILLLFEQSFYELAVVLDRDIPALWVSRGIGGIVIIIICLLLVLSAVGNENSKFVKYFLLSVFLLKLAVRISDISQVSIFYDAPKV